MPKENAMRSFPMPTMQLRKRRKLGIDVSEMLNWISIVSDKREWTMSKTRANEVLESLKSAIGSFENKRQWPNGRMGKTHPSRRNNQQKRKWCRYWKEFRNTKGCWYDLWWSKRVARKPEFWTSIHTRPPTAYIYAEATDKGWAKNPKYKKRNLRLIVNLVLLLTNYAAEVLTYKHRETQKVQPPKSFRIIPNLLGWTQTGMPQHQGLQGRNRGIWKRNWRNLWFDKRCRTLSP